MQQSPRREVDEHLGTAQGRLADLCFGASPAMPAVAGTTVGSIAVAAGVETGRDAGLCAVVEALVQEACERPRASGASDEVTVRVSAHAGRLEVEVGDLGLPISAVESRRARSRRLAARRLVDELHIGAHGSAGNLARCAVRLAADRGRLAEDRVPEESPAASAEELAALEIRPMRESDARELVRCVYRCYGYSYKDPMLYEPRAIVHALRNGAMSSVVAVTPDGSVVGHSAVFVERPGDSIPESGRLVVDPRYRGHGVAGRLCALRRERAQQEGIPGFWSQAVTNHVASQRDILAEGGSEVGLLIGVLPESMTMAGFENENGGRRPLLAMFTTLQRISLTIHLPAGHAGFVAELAARLGVERAIETEAVKPSARVSSLSSAVKPDVGLAHLRVHSIGADLAGRVADALDGLGGFDLAAVHLDLPAGDPAAAAAATALETLGFSFGAWIPKFDAGSDVLRLQRVGDKRVETEFVLCARPEGEHVRDYVIEEWHRVRRAGLG